VVGRWQPDSEARLVRAAIELFSSQGYEATSIAAIAKRAGLSPSTFFRYFHDKREILFSGQNSFAEMFAGAISEAPVRATALEAVAYALTALGERVFERDTRDLARLRQSAIASSPDLLERELLKRASLSASIASALRERGLEEPSATLVAEIGLLAFRTALTEWSKLDDERTFAQLAESTLARLKYTALALR
jgi:AcrR family transcriptional regulator